MKFQSHFALSHVVAMRLDIPSKHRWSMSAQRQKPIDFAAEGLRLALFVDRNCGIRLKNSAPCQHQLKFGRTFQACQSRGFRIEEFT